MTCNAHALAASRNMLHAADVDLIQDMVRQLPERAFVADVGCGSGTTALALLEGRSDVFVFSLDVVPENVHQWTATVVRNVFGDFDDLLTPRWLGEVDDVIRGAAGIENGAFDAAVLDVGHGYEDTVAELAAWLPKVKPGGFVIKHDYDPVEAAPELYPGVKPAVDEAVARGELEVIERRGWSVLCRRTGPGVGPLRTTDGGVTFANAGGDGSAGETVGVEAAELESAEAHETSRRLNAEDDAREAAVTTTEAAPTKAAPKARKPAQRRKRR